MCILGSCCSLCSCAAMPCGTGERWPRLCVWDPGANSDQYASCELRCRAACQLFPVCPKEKRRRGRRDAQMHSWESEASSRSPAAALHRLSFTPAAFRNNVCSLCKDAPINQTVLPFDQLWSVIGVSKTEKSEILLIVKCIRAQKSQPFQSINASSMQLVWLKPGAFFSFSNHSNHTFY